MRKLLLAAAVVALGAGSTACASKGYVRDRVGEVNDKVTTLSGTVEETQERTRKNEAKLGEHDQKIGEVGQKADGATRRAEEARSAATMAAEKADALDAASKRLVYEVVLTDDKSKFRFGRAVLSDEAKAEIDRLVEQLAADPKNMFLEIEGHTDGVGNPKYNEQLGLQRAESVKRYLYEQHNIPLHKMNVISFGEAKPIAPNNTRAGRSQNRRVVIKVLT
ncbi:MAG: OmpA family protein [Vicinamibacteraceae bacterium]|nr:OmpA family protein [Vicinamibacteraceae bacterium]